MGSLRESLLYVLSRYSEAKGGIFAGSPVAQFIRRDFSEAIGNHAKGAPLGELFTVEGSPGQGNWANVPWGAVFHRLVTESAQEGYYVVYLVKCDLSGVFLSLNQGVTTILRQYKANAHEALRVRSEDFRARLGVACDGLHSGDIDLAAPSGSGLAGGYQAGSVVDKYYPVNAIPTEEALRADLHRFLDLYVKLEMSLSTSSQILEEDEGGYFEDSDKLEFHTRIERNRSLIRAVKKAQGYKCRACGFDFAKKYRNVGKQFIEAHHLVPLSELDNGRIKLDPKTDFAVLCSNCHRMIHRTDCISDVDEFRKRYLIDNAE